MADVGANFRFESARLNSYTNWPLSHRVKPEALAAAGFYYTGRDDTVKCFECRLALRNWSQSDTPEGDHQRFCGNCWFIRGIPCGNVPIGVDPDTVPPPVERNPRGINSLYGTEYRLDAVVDGPIEVYSENTKTPISLVELQNAKYPEYADINDRISTFETWPETKFQTKEQLAEAGLYYAGKQDRTICYYCGGGLYDWKPTDVPLLEHIKWFSKCKYALAKLKVGRM